MSLSNQKCEPNWSWREEYPLNKLIEGMNSNPFILDLVPKALSLLETRFPEYKGSKWEKFLLDHEKVNKNCALPFIILD